MEHIFNADYLIHILYQTHVNSTLNQPICYNEFNIENINILENKNNIEILNNIMMKAFEKFKEDKDRYGSVHINPSFWFRVCYESILKSINNNSKIISIPNGCCNNKKCPIKKYYEIIIDEIKNY